MRHDLYARCAFVLLSLPVVRAGFSRFSDPVAPPSERGKDHLPRGKGIALAPARRVSYFYLSSSSFLLLVSASSRRSLAVEVLGGSRTLSLWVAMSSNSSSGGLFGGLMSGNASDPFQALIDALGQ